MAERFEQVYEEERPGLVRLAFLLVGSQPVAEEIVQDAFAATFRRADAVANLGGYVRTAVVRRSLTWRSRRAMEQDRLRLVPRADATDASDIDETWIAVQGLAPDLRAVLVLRYYADLPFGEIADILGIKVPTARTRAHRGLASLREELDR
jgi:RNA polymerase sigma factor (sigma-70 family)